MGNQKIDRNAVIYTLLIPLVMGIIMTIISCFFINKNGIKIDSEKSLAFINTMLGIWATLLGFMITSLSIMVGFKGSERTQIFIESKHYSTILFTYTFTCIELLLCLLIFIPVLLVDKITIFLYSLMLGLLLITAIYMFLSLLYLLLMIMTVFQKDEHENWS